MIRCGLAEIGFNSVYSTFLFQKIEFETRFGSYGFTRNGFNFNSKT